MTLRRLFDFCFIFFQEDQHEEQARDNTEDTEGHVTLTSAVIGGGAEEEGSGGADVANPLHKYMMMLMQDKQKQQVHAHHFSCRTDSLSGYLVYFHNYIYLYLTVC